MGGEGGLGTGLLNDFHCEKQEVYQFSIWTKIRSLNALARVGFVFRRELKFGETLHLKTVASSPGAPTKPNGVAVAGSGHLPPSSLHRSPPPS